MNLIQFDEEGRQFLKKILLMLSIDRFRPALPHFGLPSLLVANPETSKEIATSVLLPCSNICHPDDKNLVSQLVPRITSQYGADAAAEFLDWLSRHGMRPASAFFLRWHFFLSHSGQWSPEMVAETFSQLSARGLSSLLHALQHYYGRLAFDAQRELLEKIEQTLPDTFERRMTTIPGFDPPEWINLLLSVGSILDDEHSYSTLKFLRNGLSTQDWNNFVAIARQIGPKMGLPQKEVDVIDRFVKSVA